MNYPNARKPLLKRLFAAGFRMENKTYVQKFVPRKKVRYLNRYAPEPSFLCRDDAQSNKHIPVDCLSPSAPLPKSPPRLVRRDKPIARQVSSLPCETLLLIDPL